MIWAFLAVAVLAFAAGIYVGGAGGIILAARRVEQADRRAIAAERKVAIYERGRYGALRRLDADRARLDIAEYRTRGAR